MEPATAHRRVFARGASVAVAVVLVLAGCTPSGLQESAGVGSQGDVESAFEQAIQAAEAGGASESQVDILRNAAERGEITLTDLKDALAATYACLEAADISYQEVVTEEPWGMTVASYEMRVPTGRDVEAAAATSDECARLHSGFVEQFYVNQPKAVALFDEYRNTVVKPQIEACLDTHQIPYDSEAGFDEVWDTFFHAAMGESGNRDLKMCGSEIEGSW